MSAHIKLMKDASTHIRITRSHFIKVDSRFHSLTLTEEKRFAELSFRVREPKLQKITSRTGNFWITLLSPFFYNLSNAIYKVRILIIQ